MSVKASRAVAPGTPTFELHTLGWRAFQDLASFILREVWGQTVQPFADSNDGGRDGAFYGQWAFVGDAGLDDTIYGPFVLQCKHSAVESATLSMSALEDDLSKVEALVDAGLCTSYVLFTNARVSGNTEAKLTKELKVRGVARALVLGAGWINQTIASNQRLRMLVPRVYGLGDLSQILDERAYAQAKSLIDYLRGDLATFVVTNAYKNAAGALQDHGFVLLLGEPAAGKSVIASVLAMTALDSWGCVTIKANSPEEFIRHWNPNERSQFFWVDDAFGVVRHERARTDDWCRSLDKVMTAIRGGARVVLTSRDYIYRDARRYLKEYAYPILAENQVVVDVAELTSAEKRQILYNHIRLGDQPAKFRSSIKAYLDDVANTEPFRPEVACRLGRKAFTQGFPAIRKTLCDFMAHPHDFLRDVYAGLDEGNLGALALVYLNDGLQVPFKPEDRDIDVLDKMDASVGKVSQALMSLEDTFLRRATVPGVPEKGEHWDFRHPTLREGFARFVGENRNLLDVFIEGIRMSSLLSLVDCGSGDVRGSLIEVPPSLYRVVAKKLLRFKGEASEDWRTKHEWHQFFVDRSSPDFLRVYLDVDAQFLPELIKLWSYLDVISSPRVLARLHEVGLLDEDSRQEIFERVSELAVDTPDDGWLTMSEFGVLLTKEQRRQIRNRVRDVMIPNIDDTIEDWRLNYDGSRSSEQYYDPLVIVLQNYRDVFIDDKQCTAALDAAIATVKREIELVAEEADPPDTRPPRARPNFDTREDATGRSIFDDVDC